MYSPGLISEMSSARRSALKPSVVGLSEGGHAGGITHMLAVHRPVVQSEPARHIRPSAQSAAQEPPQSTSLSSPLSTMSVQVAVRQVIAVQTRLTQSPPVTHPRVSPQSIGHVPPQSTSVSSPLRRPSLQLGT